MRQLTVIDLCCGAGLFSAGFQRAGHKIILGIDNDPVTLSSFANNFPNAIIWETDLLEITKLPHCDIIISGPPCQPFSLANRNPNHNEGMPLVRKVIKLCKNSNVKYWIMEQVPPVIEYIKNDVPRGEIWECSIFGSKNIRPRLFAGNFPDPVPCYPLYKSPGKTVMASDNSMPIKLMRDLQGIPSWMTFQGSETQQRRQIGNGVPLEVGEALGKGILWHIQNRKINAHQQWHTMTAAFHRERGGSRSYLSAKEWRYCEECKGYIYVGPGIHPTSTNGTPPAGMEGTPKSRTSERQGTSRRERPDRSITERQPQPVKELQI